MEALQALVMFSSLLVAWCGLVGGRESTEEPLPSLPPHLRESGLPTKPEIALVEKWVEAIRPGASGNAKEELWLDGWLGAGLPFHFVYGGEAFAAPAPRWEIRCQEHGRTREVVQQEWSWQDPETSLCVTWHVRRFVKYPAVEGLLTFENRGKGETSLITDVHSLDLRMNHSALGATYTVHGANGGRCGRDDLMPFSLPVPEEGAGGGPVVELLRQDYERLEARQSILQTPLTIGERRFERGLGTHSVSRIRIHSPSPIKRFSAWIGVDHNERTRGGAGSVVFWIGSGKDTLYRSAVMRGGEPPARVEIETNGVTVLDLNVDDAGDGPSCDHADWADAAVTLESGQQWWLDEGVAAQDRVLLGSRSTSSNNHLPLFNIESSSGRGVLVGLGWAGQWRAEITRKGPTLRARAGLIDTRFRLHPGERVRTPRVLLVPWEGERLHGHNMLRQVLYHHFLPRLRDEPHRPLVSVNVCFTHHGKGGFLEQATEKEVLALLPPLLRLGIEVFIIDAGWYVCEKWWDIMQSANFSCSRERYPHGFLPIARPLEKAGVAFGLWFPPEALGSYADPATGARFLGIVANYVEKEGVTAYR
ncbi:MAG: NPCBM/NEW2 domain-containing protein [Planctomycetota bacterium]